MKRWKNNLIVLVFIAIIVFGAQIAHADGTGKCGDNLTWSLDDVGNLTISGTGEMSNYFFGDVMEGDVSLGLILCSPW